MMNIKSVCINLVHIRSAWDDVGCARLRSLARWRGALRQLHALASLRHLWLVASNCPVPSASGRLPCRDDRMREEDDEEDGKRKRKGGGGGGSSKKARR
jgi:hypothetical protein